MQEQSLEEYTLTVLSYGLGIASAVSLDVDGLRTQTVISVLVAHLATIVTVSMIVAAATFPVVRAGLKLVLTQEPETRIGVLVISYSVGFTLADAFIHLTLFG